MDFVPRPETFDKPVRYPRKQRPLRLVHSKENIIALQALGYVKGRDVGDAEACIDGKVNKVLHILADPCAVTGSLFQLRTDVVAGGI